MEKHELLYGVKAGDKVHYDFSVGLPVVKDTIEALRLTDEAWQTMLAAGENPPQPEWTQSFIAP